MKERKVLVMNTKYLKKEVEEAKKIADELGISLQEYLLLVTKITVENIETRLNGDLSVISTPAYGTY